MEFLIDTCAVLWMNLETDKLSAASKKILKDANNEFKVTAATAAEVACLSDRKRIELPAHWKPWFREMLEAHGWECTGVDLEVLEEAYSLPEPFHADPVDRILVATARLKGWTVLTGDKKILGYPHVRSLW